MVCKLRLGQHLKPRWPHCDINCKNSTNNKFAFSSDLLIKLEHYYYKKFASLEESHEVARDRKKKVRKMNERLA